VGKSTLSVSEKQRRRLVFRLKRVVTMVFGATLLASLVLGGSALAKDEKSVKLHLTPSRDSGVSGKAILTDVEGGVKVELHMKGLPEEGVKHINHIHGGGTCADDRDGRTAPVTIPLNTVVANADGTGSATTTLKDVTLKELLGDDQHRFILLHAEVKKGQGVPPGISCADLPQWSTDTTFESLPTSGGLPPAVLLIIPSILLVVGIISMLMLLRNIA
jgi:Cu/Zn superoxide dismutase